ncbi:MAG TPA: methyltransferase domain-containing protein [Phycisphaerae bacterium]
MRRRRPAVQRYHDRVAPRYDATYDDAYWAWHDALTWDHLKPHLPEDLRAPVVDLGCGTGKWAAKIARSGFSVTCVDISVAMLEQARQKLHPQISPIDADESTALSTPAATDLPLPPGSEPRRISERSAGAPPVLPLPSGERVGVRGTATKFVQADLMDLSALPAQHFALAVAFGEPLGSTASPATALKQIRRILAPQGKLVATFDNLLNALDFYVQQGDPRGLEEFLRSGVTHWLTRDRGEQFPIHTWTPDRLRKLLETAGFEVVDMIGKTVLPMRHYRELLEDPKARRAWMKIEKSLWRDPPAIGRAAHLQVVARPTP